MKVVRNRAANKYTYIAAAATTVVSDGPCVLRKIIVNGGTLTGTIKVIDNTSGTTANVATIGANQAVGQEFAYDVEMTKGLIVITSANVDITVITES